MVGGVVAESVVEVGPYELVAVVVLTPVHQCLRVAEGQGGGLAAALVVRPPRRPDLHGDTESQEDDEGTRKGGRASGSNRSALKSGLQHTQIRCTYVGELPADVGWESSLLGLGAEVAEGAAHLGLHHLPLILGHLHTERKGQDDSYMCIYFELD